MTEDRKYQIVIHFPGDVVYSTDMEDEHSQNFLTALDVLANSATVPGRNTVIYFDTTRAVGEHVNMAHATSWRREPVRHLDDPPPF